MILNGKQVEMTSYN